MFEQLPSQFPDANPDHLSALAEIWSEELNRIIKRTLEISSLETGLTVPREARHAAIFELANLRLWLEEVITKAKTEGIAIDQIDPGSERRALDSPEGKERIEGTAHLFANRIWKRLLQKWREANPAIVVPDSSRRRGPRRRVVGATAAKGVRKQHYSPTFSNEYWASGPTKKVRAYTRGVDLEIVSSDVACRSWGWESFLYSQSLESWLSLVEGDVGPTYGKLLETIPLSDLECRYWIAYLLAQVLRTPSSIMEFLFGLRNTIVDQRIDYSTNIADLRLGFESVFSNNEVFAQYYRRICGRRWKMLQPPSGSQFIRADNPVLFVGSVSKGTWTMLYPMTPDRCFVAGPEEADTPANTFCIHETVTSVNLDALNAKLSSFARKSVIGTMTAEDAHLRAVLKSALSNCAPRYPWVNDLAPEFWGELF